MTTICAFTLPISVTVPASVPFYLILNEKPDSITVIDDETTVNEVLSDVPSNAGDTRLYYSFIAKVGYKYTISATKGNKIPFSKTVTVIERNEAGWTAFKTKNAKGKYSDEAQHWLDIRFDFDDDSGVTDPDDWTGKKKWLALGDICHCETILFYDKPILQLNITPLGKKVIWLDKGKNEEQCFPVEDVLDKEPCKNTGGVDITIPDLNKHSITIEMECYKDYSFDYCAEDTVQELLPFRFDNAKDYGCDELIGFLEKIAVTENSSVRLKELMNVSCQNVAKETDTLIVVQNNPDDLYITLEYFPQDRKATLTISSCKVDGVLLYKEDFIAREDEGKIWLYETNDNSYDTIDIELIPNFVLLDINPPGPKLLLIDEGTQYEQCININESTLCEQYSTVKVCLEPIWDCALRTESEWETFMTRNWETKEVKGKTVRTFSYSTAAKEWIDSGKSKEEWLNVKTYSDSHTLNIIIDGVRQTTAKLVNGELYTNGILNPSSDVTLPLSISGPASVVTACKGINRYNITLPFEQKTIDGEIVYTITASNPKLTINTMIDSSSGPKSTASDLTLINLTTGTTVTGETPWSETVSANSSFEVRINKTGYEPIVKYIPLIKTSNKTYTYDLNRIYKYPISFPIEDTTITVTNISTGDVVTESLPKIIYLEQGTYEYKLTSTTTCYEDYTGIIPLECFINCTETPIVIRPIRAPVNWKTYMKIDGHMCTIDDVMRKIMAFNKNIFFSDYVVLSQIIDSEAEINNDLDYAYTHEIEWNQEIRDEKAYLRKICIDYTCYKLLQADATNYTNWDEWIQLISQFEAAYWTGKRSIRDSRVKDKIDNLDHTPK